MANKIARDFDIASYLHFVGQRKLMASKCRDCDKFYLPPRPICSACRGHKMVWAELQGDGKIIGFTTIAIVPPFMATKGFGRDKPYVSAIVSMREGPDVTARIEVDVTAGEPSVSVGMPVKADFLEEPDGDEKKITLVFRPQ